MGTYGTSPIHFYPLLPLWRTRRVTHGIWCDQHFPTRVALNHYESKCSHDHDFYCGIFTHPHDQCAITRQPQNFKH